MNVQQEITNRFGQLISAEKLDIVGINYAFKVLDSNFYIMELEGRGIRFVEVLKSDNFEFRIIKLNETFGILKQLPRPVEKVVIFSLDIFTI